jgi:hypothetical protein
MCFLYCPGQMPVWTVPYYNWFCVPNLTFSHNLHFISLAMTMKFTQLYNSQFSFFVLWHTNSRTIEQKWCPA